MRILLSITGFILFAQILNSCNRNPSPITTNGSRDTMLSNFFAMVDTFPYYDTNNLDYRFLKAYTKNDTLALKSIISYLKFNAVTPWMDRYLKPCARNQDFDTIKVDEAYRFIYEASFCEYNTIATIYRKDESIRANVVVYKNASIMDSIPCTIAQQNETIIDSKSWDKFKDEILFSDFWGLKEDNDYHGLDGRSIEVLGYQKEYRTMRGTSERRKYVYRWSRSMEGLTGPFLMILRFCKIDTGCLRPG